MSDLPQTFAALVQSLQSQGYPEATTIASLLHLDTSKATTSMSKRGVLAIYGARFEDGTKADVIATASPRKLLNVVLHNSPILYSDLSNTTFGASQRIERSKFSTGLAILFEIGGLTCGFTAPSPDQAIDSLFCEEMKARNENESAQT